MTIDSSAKGPNGQIILFGDSITEGAFETGSCFSYGAALSHGAQLSLQPYTCFKAATVANKPLPSVQKAIRCHQ